MTKLLYYIATSRFSIFKRWIVLPYLVLLIAGSTSSQTILYQDIFSGGVTAGGFSTGMGAGSGTVQLYIEPGSTIRKAFLFAFSTFDAAENLYVNGTPFLFSETNRVSTFNHANQDFTPIHLHMNDVTEWLIDNYTDNFLMSVNIQSGMPFEAAFAPFIVVMYDNMDLVKTAITIVGNNQPLIGNELYSVSNLFNIDTNNPVGFALYTDRTQMIPYNKKEVYFNNHLLGTCGAPDNVNSSWNAGGVKGHFYYQNNQLYGLDDDTPDNIMGDADGLADVSSYLPQNSTALSFSLRHVDYPNQLSAATHVNLAYFLSYSTPCDVFTASVSENITTCAGRPTPLHATGGNAYEWLPQVDLSCYDCASPVFVGDTSRFYTCRIWNTDSCSKVRPVKVNVRSNPLAPAFNTLPTECYGNTGRIQVTAAPQGFTYALNGGSAQAQPLFQNLAEGDYVLTAIDSNGCKADTTVHIGVVNSTVAQFVASPQSGNIPLEVTLTNQSTSATNYVWYIGRDTVHTASTAPFTHTFHEPGSFDIALVAYHTLEACSDTSYLNIATEYPFTVIIPTLYGGYMDGSSYRIYTSGVKSLEYKLYSNDGRLVRILEANPSAGYLPLWDSTDMASGLYIYNLRVRAEDGAEKVFTGKVVVI
jgi:hypothetical protein